MKFQEEGRIYSFFICVCVCVCGDDTTSSLDFSFIGGCTLKNNMLKRKKHICMMNALAYCCEKLFLNIILKLPEVKCRIFLVTDGKTPSIQHPDMLGDLWTYFPADKVYEKRKSVCLIIPYVKNG